MFLSRAGRCKFSSSCGQNESHAPKDFGKGKVQDINEKAVVAEKMVICSIHARTVGGCRSGIHGCELCIYV